MIWYTYIWQMFTTVRLANVSFISLKYSLSVVRRERYSPTVIVSYSLGSHLFLKMRFLIIGTPGRFGVSYCCGVTPYFWGKNMRPRLVCILESRSKDGRSGFVLGRRCRQPKGWKGLKNLSVVNYSRNVNIIQLKKKQPKFSTCSVDCSGEHGSIGEGTQPAEQGQPRHRSPKYARRLLQWPRKGAVSFSNWYALRHGQLFHFFLSFF